MDVLCSAVEMLLHALRCYSVMGTYWSSIGGHKWLEGNFSHIFCEKFGWNAKNEIVWNTRQTAAELQTCFLTVLYNLFLDFSGIATLATAHMRM